MTTLVKICGLSTPETLQAALEARADFVGFVFFPKSPRNVLLRQAASLAAQARGRATARWSSSAASAAAACWARASCRTWDTPK